MLALSTPESVFRLEKRETREKEERSWAREAERGAGYWNAWSFLRSWDTPQLLCYETEIFQSLLYNLVNFCKHSQCIPYVYRTLRLIKISSRLASIDPPTIERCFSLEVDRTR